MNTARRILLVLLVCLGASASQAMLGEPAAKYRERYGKPAPQLKNDPTSQVWFFEGDDGQLVFTVTFNAKGRSIAEGLKPLKHAKFPRETVQDFVDGQLDAIRGSQSTVNVKSGEKYVFAGKAFVCSPDESVVVDDPKGLLIVWTRGGNPSVIAVAPEMVR